MMSGIRATLVLLVLVALGATEVSLGLSPDGCWNWDCLGGNFSSLNGYQMKLNQLEEMLLDQASFSTDKYSAVSIGSKEDKIFSVAVCRRDISHTSCKQCLAQAVQSVQAVCGSQERATIYYDFCTLDISTTEITFPPVTPRIASQYNNSRTTIQRKLIDTSITSLRSAVTKRAVQSHSRFATGQWLIDGKGNTLYSLAQCVPTLKPEDCQICLENVISGNVFEDLVGGRMGMIWCSYRFELFKFFKSRPMLHLPAPNGNQDGHHHKKRIAIIVVCVVVAVVVLIAITVLLIWWIKRRNKSGKQKGGDDEEGSSRNDKVLCQSALDHFHEVVELVSGRTIALFLDYDGTLSPIVNDPDRAYMSDEMRRVVRRAADLFNTAIVSGRSRRKVTNFVQLEDLSYAGSHGMDIMVSTKHNASTSTGGSEIETVDEPCLFQPAARFLPLMAKVKRALEEAITEIKGATVEDNVFSVSVHFRNVHEKFHLQVKKKVKSVLKKGKDFADLKLTTGKMVLEVRPDIKWNKGNAVVFLLDTLKLDNPDEVFPIYIGDDRTDEDAFEVLRDRGNGIGILVSEVNQETHAFYRLRSPDEEWILPLWHLCIYLTG